MISHFDRIIIFSIDAFMIIIVRRMNLLNQQYTILSYFVPASPQVFELASLISERMRHPPSSMVC